MLITTSTLAQEQQEIQIAAEYLLKGEKQKALTLYEALAKKPENVSAIHSNYLNLLLDLGKTKQAEDYVERIIKRDDRINYRIDLGLIWIKSGDLSKGDRYLKTLIKSQTEDAYKIKTIAEYLASRNLPEYAVHALLECRKDQQNPTLFILELANYYRMQGKRDEMVEEYLRYATQNPANISYIKNLMQILLARPEELESLEKILLDRVQGGQDSEVIGDLLVWVSLQQKNFFGAFVQARAFDKRYRKEQSKTLEIAQIAITNKDYVNAEKAFAFVIKEFANTENYLPARLGVIRAREARVKQGFPVDRDSVRYLIQQYQLFRTKYPDQPSAFDATISEAALHAQYLNEKDSAIADLNKLVTNPKASPLVKTKAKIDLGDIYILNEMPWEATLLYSQVEKSQRETSLAYDAKLKNARLSYFKGDFGLAQEHLDILKQATTREISNDAMELSMRIAENTAFDSTGAALKEYSAIELLLFQNKLTEALAKLEAFKGERIVTDVAEAIAKNKRVGDTIRTNAIETQAILDDVYWLEANVRVKTGDFLGANELLKRIEQEYPKDILADDAYFLRAELTERRLNQKEAAMELYREFLNKYPGSVYAAEARKRFRQLRGDFSVENKIN